MIFSGKEQVELGPEESNPERSTPPIAVSGQLFLCLCHTGLGNWSVFCSCPFSFFLWDNLRILNQRVISVRTVKCYRHIQKYIYIYMQTHFILVDYFLLLCKNLFSYFNFFFTKECLIYFLYKILMLIFMYFLSEISASEILVRTANITHL